MHVMQAGLRIMAKELVALRKQKERIQAQSAMMNSLQSKVAVSQSVGTMATAMGSAATIMAKQNAALVASDMPATMHRFAMAAEGMSMTEEMMDDMLADAFGEDEGAADDIISETFAEMGLGVSSALPTVPRSAVEAPAGATAIRAPAPASRTAVPAGMSSEDAAVAAVLREVLGAK